jgi:hypothetical protein
LPDFAGLSFDHGDHDRFISVPKPHESSLTGSSLASINEHGFPTLLDRLSYLQTGPASPPIVVPPAQLLETPPNREPDSAHQHSIASPFVNLNTGVPTPQFPFPNSALRTAGDRRRSSLINEWTAPSDDPIHDTTDADDTDTDDDPDPAVPVPRN